MDTLRKIINKQNNADMCAVCGKINAHALGTDFYELEGGVVYSVTHGRNEHQSYPGRMHGGLITAVLDETIGRAIQIGSPESWGVTSKIEVVFKKPVPLNEPIRCFGKITKTYSFAFTGKGYIEDADGNVLACANASYVRVPVEKIVNGAGFTWENFPVNDPPVSAAVLHPELLE
ncbi:MAG: PaaI family thioesterase [Clostridia bacterium]|nr:PaaI family thioesterase [Clostridia bacterium]